MISFIFSASQMLILNPSRCKREGTEKNLRILKYSNDLYIFTPINRNLAV